MRKSWLIEPHLGLNLQVRTSLELRDMYSVFDIPYKWDMGFLVCLSGLLYINAIPRLFLLVPGVVGPTLISTSMLSVGFLVLDVYFPAFESPFQGWERKQNCDSRESVIKTM